jgi:phage terminase large subunit-like protein
MVVAERVAMRPTPEIAEIHAPDGSVREFSSYGGRVGSFIEDHCCFTKGKYRGKPFDLQEWEWQLLYEIFEVVPDDELGWRRKYREAYIEISKKNGKSELIAGIDLYLLVADFEESPEIACAANSDKQADLVFGACRAMVDLSHQSRAARRGDAYLSKLIEPFATELVLRENPAAKIVRVSATVGTNDGNNFSGITLDEFHEFIGPKGEGVYGVLTNATVSRDEPLTLIITTAGADLNTPCGRMHQKAERILRGSDEDPTFYAKFYQASDPDVDLDDREALIRALKEANPNYGITVHLPFYLDRLRKVSAAVFKRYFLGLWVRDNESRWLPPGAWEACQAEPFDLVEGEPLYVGADGSLSRDSTSLALVQPHGENLRVKWQRWRPEVNPVTGRRVENWTMPQDEVEAFLLGLGARFEVRAIVYDPFAFTLLMQKAGQAGLPVLDFPQTDARMVPATTTTRDLISARRIEHDGDPIAAEQMADAVAKAGRFRTGDRIVKTADRKPNDDVVALVMAVSEAGKPPEPAQAAPGMFFLDATGGG